MWCSFRETTRGPYESLTLRLHCHVSLSWFFYRKKTVPLPSCFTYYSIMFLHLLISVVRSFFSFLRQKAKYPFWSFNRLKTFVSHITVQSLFFIPNSLTILPLLTVDTMCLQIFTSSINKVLYILPLFYYKIGSTKLGFTTSKLLFRRR